MGWAHECHRTGCGTTLASHPNLYRCRVPPFLAGENKIMFQFGFVAIYHRAHRGEKAEHQSELGVCVCLSFSVSWKSGRGLPPLFRFPFRKWHSTSARVSVSASVLGLAGVTTESVCCLCCRIVWAGAVSQTLKSINLNGRYSNDVVALEIHHRQCMQTFYLQNKHFRW